MGLENAQCAWLHRHNFLWHTYYDALRQFSHGQLVMYNTNNTVVLSLSSPWYNRTGWLGVKHQLTYLLSLSLIFSTTILWSERAISCFLLFNVRLIGCAIVLIDWTIITIFFHCHQKCSCHNWLYRISIGWSMHQTAHQLVISEFDPPLTVDLHLNQSRAFEIEN